MPELLQEFFEDKEKFAVLVPGLIALIVLLVAYGQWRTLKKEETRWRAWMRLLLAFGFVFGCIVAPCSGNSVFPKKRLLQRETIPGLVLPTAVTLEGHV